MSTDTQIAEFYAKVPYLGDLIGSRMGWQKITFADSKTHIFELQQRGIFGILPFVSCNSGTIALYLKPQQSLRDAAIVLAFPDFPECMTIADDYDSWLIGLLNYEDWANRDRGEALDHELRDISTAITKPSLEKFDAWLLAEDQIKNLKTRAERIAWGFDFLAPSNEKMQFLSRVWALRKEAVANEAGQFLQKFGLDRWILPIRVFAGYLAFRKAPIALHSYAEPVFYNQQLNDATYLGYHQGNVPGSWADRPEVRLASWLIENKEIDPQNPLLNIVKSIHQQQEAYQGDQHLALARKIKTTQAESAYYLLQAAMIYQEKGDFGAQLTELKEISKAENWPFLSFLLRAISNPS